MSTNFKLKIECESDNAAASEGKIELHRILKNIITGLDLLKPDGEISGKIMDVNGNSIGYYEIEVK